MKLTTFIILISLMQVSASTFGQKMTLVERSVSIEKVLMEIRKQTGYDVLIIDTKFDIKKRIKADFNAALLEQVMNRIVSGTDFTYKIDDKNVVLKQRERSFLDRVLERFAAIDVRGTVVDEKGDPLPGASVKVKGTNKVTTTDDEGEFYLPDVDEGVVLEISYVGYKTQEVKVTTNMGTIKMELGDSELEEVMVSTGYWTTTKKRSTGNISKVTSKEIEGQPVTSPLVALQGRVPGLELSLRDGATNTAPQIRIRGNNSLRGGGAYPLYIIDGVVVDSRPLGSLLSNFDPLAGINPENIESIEVLKDADATAIYGSRGANGIILISTKQSKGNTPFGIEAKAYRGIGKIPRFIDMLNTEQYLEMRREGLKNANVELTEFDYDLINWDTTKSTNWQKVLLGGSAKVSNAQLVFSGGSDHTSFSVNAGYHNETNVISDDFGFDRLSVGFNVSHKSADNRFTLSANTNFGYSRNRNLNITSVLETALSLAPNAPDLYQADGNLNWGLIYYPAYNFTLTSLPNPMAELLRTDESNSGILITNASLSYLLVKGLTLWTSLGYTETNGDYQSKNPIAALSPADIYYGSTGSASFRSDRRKSLIMEPQAAYDVKWNDHELNIIAGATFQQSRSLYESRQGIGYTSDALLNTIDGAAITTYSSDGPSEYRYAAAYTRIGYSLKEKYLLNLTGRRDGSSRFGPGKQFGNFGAIGAAWIFSGENILKNSNIINFGKLRTSFGLTGNDQIGEYQFYDLYRIANYRYMNTVALAPKGLFNPDYRWEVTKKLELALELGFLQDRLSLQASWYRNTTSNQIVNYPLPYTTGFSFIQRNFDEATIENKGLEFVLQSRNFSSKALSWETSFNISVNRNRLVSFDGIKLSPYANQYKVGESLNLENRYVWEGVDPVTGNHVIADLDGNGFVDDSDRVLGNNMDRKYYGGILNTLRYKSIELTFLFRFAKQKGMGPYLSPAGGLGANQPVEVMNRWRKEGDITDIAKFSTDYSDWSSFDYMTFSDHSIVDASFIKLGTLSLSCNIPGKLLKKAKIREAKIYVHGQNLLTIDDFIGLDPETGARTLPQLRMITGGINLKF